MWRSLVSRTVRDREAGGSNPLTPTSEASLFFDEIQEPDCFIYILKLSPKIKFTKYLYLKLHIFMQLFRVFGALVKGHLCSYHKIGVVL